MTKLTISFYGHGIDGRGGVSREVVLDTVQPTAIAPTETRFAWICPTGNSNLDAAARRYDGTLSYVIQQEGRSLAVASALYAVQRDTRSGPPADVKIKLEEGHAVDAANAEKLIKIITLMGRAFEKEFVRDWALQTSRSGKFEDVCDRIVTDHAAQIGQLATVDVSSRSNHRLAAKVSLGRDSYTAARHLPNSFEGVGEYGAALRDITLAQFIAFQDGNDPTPVVVVGNEAAQLLSERMAVTKIYQTERALFADVLGALQTPLEPTPAPAPVEPLPVEAKVAPVVETFEAAKELTADARYGIVMEHIKALATASKDKGPDGKAARQALTKITGHFATAIEVYNNKGPGK